MARVKENTDSPYKEARRQSEQVRNIAVRRKEEFLGARVPKQLRARVILRANELGIPVSILIRNILEQAFAEPLPIPLNVNEVIAWQQVNLCRSIDCSQCATKMPKGQAAHFGLGARVQTILCPLCLDSQ